MSSVVVENQENLLTVSSQSHLLIMRTSLLWDEARSDFEHGARRQCIRSKEPKALDDFLAFNGTAAEVQVCARELANEAASKQWDSKKGKWIDKIMTNIEAFLATAGKAMEFAPESAKFA